MPGFVEGWLRILSLRQVFVALAAFERRHVPMLCKSVISAYYNVTRIVFVFAIAATVSDSSIIGSVMIDA